MCLQPDNHIKVGKLNLVDLAGSERQSKTGGVHKSLQLGCLQQSLSCLGTIVGCHRRHDCEGVIYAMRIG